MLHLTLHCQLEIWRPRILMLSLHPPKANQNQSLGALGLENISTQPVACGMHYRQAAFPRGPTSAPTHTLTGEGTARPLLQPTLLRLLWLIVFVYHKLCCGLCPGGQLSWRALRGRVCRRRVWANLKTQWALLALPVGRTRRAAPPEQQLRHKSLFKKMLSNSCVFKGF